MTAYHDDYALVKFYDGLNMAMAWPSTFNFAMFLPQVFRAALLFTAWLFFHFVLYFHASELAMHEGSWDD